MKYFNYTLALILLTTGMAYGQVTFTVDDFSNYYYGKLFISDTTEVFSPGWVAIYNKKTQQQLIKVESEELTFTLHDGRVKANIRELPYGEQSQIIYEDFNFDGRNDFAIMDGQNSCYHGPSFQIYLTTDNGLKYSPEFTQLAQEYCGMFNIDPQEKRISTMTKSGCCWHQFSEFMVQNNKPVAIKIVEESYHPTGIMWDYVENNRINGKMVETHYSLYDNEGEMENLIYYFEFNNGKKMRLLGKNGDLYYVFTDKDNKVEKFHYESFYYSTEENAIWFTTGDTTYKITSSGIIVTTQKKEIEMTAKTGSIRGSLSTLQDAGFENVGIE